MPPSEELTEALLAAQHWHHWWLRAQKDTAAAALRADREYHKRVVMLDRIAERERAARIVNEWDPVDGFVCADLILKETP